MSKFLRDRYIRNLSLNEERLNGISEILKDVAQAANRGLEENDPRGVLVTYIIRFDNKGFLLDDFETVLGHHRSAKKTERLTFLLQSDSSRKSGGHTGKMIDIRFDAINENNCLIAVQDDDATWTDAVFCRIDEELRKYGSRNYLVRTGWTPLIVQILGNL